MPRYGFTSPGAMAGNAIEQFLVQRALQQRQQQMDALAQQQQEAEIGQRDQQLHLQQEQERRIAEAQRQQQSDLEQERQFRRAGTIAENALPGDQVDDPTRALLTQQGYGGQMAQVPGVLMQGPLQEGEERPSSPDNYQMRGGSKYLNQRAAEDARAALAEENRAAADERAQHDRELRELIARMQASGSAESRSLSNELKRLQISMAGDKIEAGQKAKGDAATAVKTGRQTIRDLAQGLYDDSDLDAIAGGFAARMPTVRENSVDAEARLKQLISQLSLESRGKLKGQGQISDYEAKILANAASAIDLKAGAKNVKTHLKEIIDAFQGDAPNAGPTTSGGAHQVGEKRTYPNGRTATWDGTGWVAD